MNNIDDIVFIYNADKSNDIGIYLLCKIISKMDEENAVQMKVIKDFRDKPFNYKDTLQKLYCDYNTEQGKNKRQQFSMIVEESYNPKALYTDILNSQTK